MVRGNISPFLFYEVIKLSKYFEPINITPPPLNSQVKVPCATCSKFPVCNLRESALKTAYLIQQIMGDPQIDYEIKECDCSYVGRPFEDISFFPETIDAKDTRNNPCTGTIMEAKYKNKDHIQVLYNIDGYYVVISLKWDNEENIYKVSNGKELYYNLKYTINEISKTALSTAPLNWREEMIRKEEDTKDADVINTTYFSAKIDCSFYEYERGLTEEEGWRRIELQYAKEPVHAGCGYEHLLTYHIEPKRVPFEDLRHSFAPMPVLYPVFIPKKDCPPPKYPPRRRDDID